jgi:hypothetical protein
MGSETDEQRTKDKLKFVRKRQINRIQMNSKIHRRRIYRPREARKEQDEAEGKWILCTALRAICRPESARCEL